MELGDAEDELDQLQLENEQGFGKDLDVGDIAFNPMATGVPGMNRPADAFGNELYQRQIQQQNELLDVQAEVFQVRQDYGQVATGSRKRKSYEKFLDTMEAESKVSIQHTPSMIQLPDMSDDDLEAEADFEDDQITKLKEVQTEIDTTKEAVESAIETTVDREVMIDRVDDGAKHLMKAEMHQRSYRKMICLLCLPCCMIIFPIYYGCVAINKLSNGVIKWMKSRKLVDNVFADLENMFYLLSNLLTLFKLGFSSNRNIVVNIIMNLFKFILLTLIIYPLIIIICIVIILPSLFFLLIVRMNKIETDTKKLNHRMNVLEQESRCKRFIRLISQFVRSSFMFSFIGIYPIIITYIIIPKYGNHDYVVLTSVGSYLFIILLLQIFGTYRGLKSFKEKSKKIKKIDQQFKPQKFSWNIGSIIAIILLVHEIFQFTMFATHVIDSDARQNSTDDTANNSDDKMSNNNNKIMAFMIKISYISFEFVSGNLMEFYSFFNFIAVGLLLLFFIFRFVFELKKYGKLKYIENKIEEAQNFYFHSFVGTIIYGHGTLKNLNKFSCKIVSLLSDTLFLIICEKLILLISCTSPTDANNNVSYLRIDESVVCWEGKHKLYATINLILIGYYIPICVMIAPMFSEEDENEEESEKEDKKQENKSCFMKFISFSNTVNFVKPFLSTITVTKCFMLISATFLFRGDVLGTIVSQSISMITLLLFTLIWSFNDLKLNGLTQNQPGFPFSVNLIRTCGFICGFCGCVVEILRLKTDFIDSAFDFYLLLSIMTLSAIIILIVFLVYHGKYDKFDDNVECINWIIKYEILDDQIKVIPFESASNNAIAPSNDIDPKQLEEDLSFREMDDVNVEIDTFQVRSQ